MAEAKQVAVTLARIAGQLARHPDDVAFAEASARALGSIEAGELIHSTEVYCYRLVMDELISSNALRFRTSLALERRRAAICRSV